MDRRFVASGVLLLALIVPASAQAGLTITGYAFGSEGLAISGVGPEDHEDFEDVNLIPRLTIKMSGRIATTTVWTGTMPRTWLPSSASSVGSLGGPFNFETWDGTRALCNGGFGTGVTGFSPHNGNYWDHTFADSVFFLIAAAPDDDSNKGCAMFGVGLSNFQSIGGIAQVTNHELIVNGVSQGNLETLLPGYVAGPQSRFRYLLIQSTDNDITSVCIRNNTAEDGLVFDELVIGNIVPAQAETWGHLKSTYR